ncbi:S41 family peptidase [Pelomonas sp. CA6]|uniref:S41 family peptidase n=1 Tax=Pelomonas sp. CA6 TaxID=2907999 RepID=UPI001F4BD25D|nr:S41 family peptidase [Pelomonas sp. CA6]MCH7343258.1 S41 family peptidase [Pelomonas sp. CA6]
MKHATPSLSPLAAALGTVMALLLTPVQAQNPGYYRQPALQGEQLVFVAEGDLWRSAVQGGPAQRLTTHAGAETMPALSPDGRWLAFVGQYDGGAGDVYVMPVAGGVPKRLSWHASNQLKVWGITAQGEVLYTGPTDSGQPGTQLHAVDLSSAKRRSLPVGQASDGALSADGKTLYFTRNGLRGDNARQYRGGAIARLWVLDLSSQAEARPLLAEGHNDRRPMPYRDAAGAQRIAFLSDRDGSFNVWSVDAQGRDLRQHTQHKGWDVRHASLDARAGGSQLVYALGADLYRLDLNQAAAAQKLAIQLSGDFDQQRQRWVAKPQDFLTHTAFAPNGERVVLTSRGRLATQGVTPLRRAELAAPAGLADAGRCRDAEFSADSRSVFALCDYSGELEIWRFAANGLAAPQQITQGADAMRQSLLPSPDGRWIAHTDKQGRLHLTDLQAKDIAQSTRVLDRDTVSGGIADLRWSPDGRALAYTRNLRNPWREQLMLVMVADGKPQPLPLTSDRYASASPAFSPDGQWLYFLSRRQFGATNTSGPWGDRNMGPQFDRAWKVYALALQPGLRFPFAATDELAADKADAKPEAKADAASGAKSDAKSDAKPAPKNLPAIVTAGLAQRLYEVPVAASNYSELQVDAKRLWLLDGARRNAQLKLLNIGPQESKTETVSEQVQQFGLSRDGKKLMLRRGAPGATPEILIVDAAAKLPAELAKHQVGWSDWQIATDPRAEWRQMFADAWRMQRDFFYDKNMHGVDWAAMRAKYEPLVERVTERGELADLMQQLVGELSLLHSQVAASDVRKGPEEPGLAGLGAQLVADPAGWRVAKLYSGDPELPSEAGPLSAPGLQIAVGSVITAVNGRAAAGVAHPSELLRGQAGKQVLLQLKEPDGRSRQVVVTPVDAAREAQLRLNDWRYGRAALVQSAGQGRIGYLHLRAMGPADIADFAREFYAQVDREGLIIDVRYNNGGNIDSWILEKLMRRAWMYWQARSPSGAAPYPNMQQAFRGPIVVLANEETYSDGETFSEGFKRLGLGPVIGKTTSGAGVWLSDQNRLIDNGIMRAAEFGQMTPEGRFIIEGQGVTPDIEVDNPPRATAMGQDAQLDAAIQVLKKAIDEKPVKLPTPGAYLRPIKQ